jgi:hypothetical protein
VSGFVEYLAFHAIDGPELSGSIQVGLGFICANPLGQTVQTNGLFAAHALPILGRKTTNGPLKGPLSVEGPSHAQVSTDPSEGTAQAAQPQHFAVNGFGRIRHGVTS